MRKAKIVATLGPASNNREMIRDLIQTGVDVVRLNFSHGNHESHGESIDMVRSVAVELKKPVGILQDLPGPKIRTGRLRQRRPIVLVAGETVRLTPDDIVGNAARLSVNYPHLSGDARPGDRILLSDGLIELTVQAIEGPDVLCEIRNGGLLGEHKGVNLPGVKLRIPAMTPNDEHHLRFGLSRGVDYIAVSFVRSAADLGAVKQIVRAEGKDTPVFAKIEKPEAVEALDDILGLSDGVMVARGDLGVEMPPEKVPVVQKMIIERAALLKIPVITATQMLESMMTNPRPTRAEASDVANAVFDGTDAIMLSGETAAGKHPRQAVEIMSRIAVEAEAYMDRMGWRRRPREVQRTVPETISDAVAHATNELGVKAVVVFTRSGSTARLISKFRPLPPIHAFCHEEYVSRRLALYRGVVAWHMPLVGDTDSTISCAEGVLLRNGCVSKGDIIACIAGSPFGVPGGTNMMKLVRVGEWASGGGAPAA
jgi:pyruvate kinase